MLLLSTHVSSKNCLDSSILKATIMKPVTFTLLFTLASSYASLLIPPPKGPYGTNVAVTALTDTSQIDPFAPTKEHRSVVVSAFYPVARAKDCEWEDVHQFPLKTGEILNSEVAMFGVPNGTFEKIETQICKAHATCRGRSSQDTCCYFLSWTWTESSVVLGTGAIRCELWLRRRDSRFTVLCRRCRIPGRPHHHRHQLDLGSRGVRLARQRHGRWCEFRLDELARPELVAKAHSRSGVFVYEFGSFDRGAPASLDTPSAEQRRPWPCTRIPVS